MISDSSRQEQLTITGVEPGRCFTSVLSWTTGTLHAVVEKQLRENGWVRAVFIKSSQLGGSTYTAGTCLLACCS